MSQDEKNPEDKTSPAFKGGGESGGGAYPNPHSGKEERSDGFFGHGGQSDMEYHGSGQLGEEKVGENANAPAGKGKAARD